MPLSQEEINKITQQLLEVGGIFSSPIPTTVEEAKAYMSKDKGFDEIHKLTEAVADKQVDIIAINGINEYLIEIIDTALMERDNEKSVELSGILAAQKTAKALKHKVIEKKDQAQGMKRSASENLDEKAIEAKNLKLQLKTIKQQMWEEKLKLMSANLNIASASFTEMSRQAGIGAAKLTAEIAGGCQQFATNCKYYANECYKMSKRSIEDAPEKMNKMFDAMMEGINNTFKSAAKFLHEAKKALDPLRALHHERKENAAFRKNFEVFAEQIVVLNQSQARSNQAFSLALENNVEEALAVQHTETPAEKQIRERAENAASVELARIAAEKKALNDKNEALFQKIKADVAKSLSRSKEDELDRENATGVGKKVSKEVESYLRGSNVVDGLRGRASSASDVEDSKAPSATGVRPRSTSTPERV